MKVSRIYDEQNKAYNYRFEEDNSALIIVFAGNLDLYFALHSKNIYDNNTFYITKENMTIYNLFENLCSDIKDINLFDGESSSFYIETQKIGYRSYNKSNYNELYNPDTNTITWYSDETTHEVANILKINKEDENFKLEFFVQPDKGYEKDLNSRYSITIRFRNSGSRYNPFNICFMKIYKELQKYDPEYHQMTIEEYEYKRKVLKNEKK